MITVPLDIAVGDGSWRATQAIVNLWSVFALVTFTPSDGSEPKNSRLDLGKGRFLDELPVEVQDHSRISVLDAIHLRVEVERAVDVLKRHAPEKLA